MAKVESFVFNPFQENTFVVYDDSGECVIIDPGCSTEQEEKELCAYIESKGLRPVALLQTHCHIDHILGCRFVFEKYGLKPLCHPIELQVLQAGVQVAEMYGIFYKEAPEPVDFIQEGTAFRFGNTELEIFFTPGHSPGSVVFFSKKDGFVLAGDVLFYGSIGRTDLPGGDFQTLMNSIHSQLLVLPDETVVHCGHGPNTTIGRERTTNPFILGVYDY